MARQQLLLLATFLVVVSVSHHLVCVSAQDYAHLLLDKRVLEKNIVIGKEATIQLQLFNPGSSAAYQVSVADPSWVDTEVFEIVEGETTFAAEKLISGSNITHTFVVRAIQHGHVHIEPAHVKYETTEKGREQEGFSNELKFRVLSRKFVDRDMSSYMYEWGIFSAMALVPILVPLMIYVFIKLNFENGNRKTPKPKSS